MSKEMEALAAELKSAEELKAFAHQLIASGAEKLDPDVIAGLRALDKEINESREVLREAVH